MSRRRVVITGMGVVSPLGLTLRDTWDKLLHGVSGAAPVTRFDTSKHATTFACEVKGFRASWVERGNPQEPGSLDSEASGV